MRQGASLFVVLVVVMAFVVFGCSKRAPEIGLVATVETEFKKNAMSVGAYVVAAQDMTFTNAIPLYSQALAANDKCLELVHFLTVIKAVESCNFADVPASAAALISSDPDNVEYAAVRFLCLHKGGDDAGAQMLADKINGLNNMTEYESEIWKIASLSNYPTSVASQLTKRQLEFIHMLIRYRNGDYVVSEP
jgi:hypothetical protein